MTKKRWFFLWLLFIGYLFLGAFLFYSIERDLEEKHRREKARKSYEIHEILEEHITLERNWTTDPRKKARSLDTLLTKLSQFCGRPILKTQHNTTTDNEPYTWTFYNSFFFALTTLSTIGYGNLSPTSQQGKIWVIVYSLIGIPFNGIVLAHLGEFFGSKFLRAHHRYKNHIYESRVSLIVDILVYLIPGMIIFILAPSALFIYYENWSFIESIYYSFVTLTTIGYGDFVAGQTASTEPFDIAYRIFLLIWIMFGLGYLVMILGFITRAMRSKQINKLEKKVAHTLKQTQSKIWHEFVHDIHLLRRLLNEMYLMKVKPVYKEKSWPPVRPSQSCPNLSEWPVLRAKGMEEICDKVPPKRRRAFSENEQPIRFHRVLSDGALEGIDRQATFSAAGFFDPMFLPSSFGPGSPEESDPEDYMEGGLNVFSDEEILASEDYPSSKASRDSWYIGDKPVRRKGRAMSDAQYITQPLGNQKTWAGAESLHHFAILKAMRAKSNEWTKDGTLDEERGMKEPEERPKGLRRLSMAAINFLSPSSKLKKKKSSTTDISRDPDGGRTNLKRGSPKHRLSLQEVDHNDINTELNYYTHLRNDRRPSLLDILVSGHGSESPISPVLEQTSIADFIRAVHGLRAMEVNRAASPTQPWQPPRGPRGEDRGRERSIPTLALPPHLRQRLSDRRHSSQVPSQPIGLGRTGRRRAASIAPVLSGPVASRLQKASGSPLSSGQVTPARHHGPSLVVTSPDGKHKFSVQNVDNLLPLPRPPLKRADTSRDFFNKP